MPAAEMGSINYEKKYEKNEIFCGGFEKKIDKKHVCTIFSEQSDGFFIRVTP